MIIATGKVRAFTCLLRPFKDDLSKVVPWLFYAVPESNGYGPATVFTDRFWDDREHWIPDSVGVVPFSMRPYWGPIPLPTLAPVRGTADEWVNGVSYAVYAGGGYHALNSCAPIIPNPKIIRIKQCQSLQFGPVTFDANVNQVQYAGPWPLIRHGIGQVQAAWNKAVNKVYLDQAQKIEATPASPAELHQVQAANLNPVADAAVNQVQAVRAYPVTPCAIAQGQGVVASASNANTFIHQVQTQGNMARPANVMQSQQWNGYLYADKLVLQAQLVI